MFSKRTAWDLRANAIAERLEALRAAGRSPVDLTDSNPTRCGLAWNPGDLAAALADPRIGTYDPSPQGWPDARAAVAGYLASRGAAVVPERVVLTASTSEGYALLMKLLCDPGEEWLVPAPSYPLLDLLADLESVNLRRYPLRHDGEWRIDRAALEAAISERTRAVAVVSPSNPTGALLDPSELAFLEELCAERRLALVGDEVFADTAARPAPSVASVSRCLAFHLSGLSKICGLPQLKAAWIAVAGPEELAAASLARLEMIADSYLSISGPAQLALPVLLARRESFLVPLRARLSRNRAVLAAAALANAPFSVLRGDGGWNAVLRVGEALDEEAVALELLDRGVSVQPGFFYDFERPGHLVVSLLPEPARFDDGLGRLAEGLRDIAGR